VFGGYREEDELVLAVPATALPLPNALMLPLPPTPLLMVPRMAPLLVREGVLFSVGVGASGDWAVNQNKLLADNCTLENHQPEYC